MTHLFYKLTLVTRKHTQSLNTYLNFVRTCVNLGITCVQLREKTLPYEEILKFGQRLQEMLLRLNIPLIVNDNVQLALQLDAFGVHLGQTDGHVLAARKLLGKDKCIGLTINSVAQLCTANTLPIDYVGIGAIFPTQNKTDVQTIWGCQRLKYLVSLSHHPIVAIGGITLSNAWQVMRSGVDGIAAIEAFHAAQDLNKVIRGLRYMIESVKHA